MTANRSLFQSRESDPMWAMFGLFSPVILPLILIAGVLLRVGWFLGNLADRWVLGRA